jgi:hypothetical protein
MTKLALVKALSISGALMIFPVLANPGRESARATSGVPQRAM